MRRTPLTWPSIRCSSVSIGPARSWRSAPSMAVQRSGLQRSYAAWASTARCCRWISIPLQRVGSFGDVSSWRCPRSRLICFVRAARHCAATADGDRRRPAHLWGFTAALNFFDRYMEPGEYLIIEDGIVKELRFVVYENGLNRASTISSLGGARPSRSTGASATSTDATSPRIPTAISDGDDGHRSLGAGCACVIRWSNAQADTVKRIWHIESR